MRHRLFDLILTGARQRLTKLPVEKSVVVDRDQLRTVLMQCEHELRDMHRLVEKSAVMKVRKQVPPAPRY